MKKQLLAVTALTMACVLFAACGKAPDTAGGGGEDVSAVEDTVTAAPDDDSAEGGTYEDAAAEPENIVDDAGEKTGQDNGDAPKYAEERPINSELLEATRFTKTVSAEDLDRPITVCCLKFDEDKDKKFEDSMTQERDRFHLHIGILGEGYDMESYLAASETDNYQYVASVAQGHNIQRASAANNDDSAKLTIIRFTNLEDGGENDYQYMGTLVYTDGVTVAATEFFYTVDREYANGEEVEAEMSAITGYYGIDYGALDWTDVENESD